ncbi:GNAT family N-acetyltransferase [Burkholderiaceae bacterium DAT-1]|nr:GNAT family N-acetyltransferase [Burkholderiaceae bacterium DAT-1]
MLEHADFIIRLADHRDCPAIVDFFRRNRDTHAPFTPKRPESFYSDPFWEMRVETNRKLFDQQQSCNLFIFTHDSSRVLGDINFSSLNSYPAHSANLGYALDHTLWGKGTMHDALKLAIQFAFQHFNLHRISANHIPDNARSERLLAKLGFVREGYAKDYLLINGLWHDHVLNSLTRSNWEARDHTRPLVVNGTGKPE